MWLQAAGGDAFDMYLYDDGGTDVRTFAFRTARALGAGASPPVDLDPFDSTAASVQLDRRLARRSAGDLVWSPDTEALLAAVGTLGYEQVDLVVCTPRIERSFQADRPPLDPDWLDVDDRFQCPGWHLSFAEGPLALTVTLRPDGSRYTRGLLVPLALAMAALAALAGLAAVAVRRRLLPTLTGVTTAVGLGAACAAVMAVPVAAAVIAWFDRPVVNWVMADDHSVPEQFLATVAPAWLAALPPLAFAVVVLRAPLPPFRPAVGPPPSPSGPGLPAWLAASRRAAAEPPPQGPPVVPALPPRTPAPVPPSDWPREPPP